MSREPWVYLPIRVPASLLTRLNAAAPPEEYARSAFVRDALKRRLAELEREAADRSLRREADRDT